MTREYRPWDQKHSWGHLGAPDVLAPSSDHRFPFFVVALW